MTGRGIEVYIDLPLKNPYKEYYNILHTKTFWYLANSITKCYKKNNDPPLKNPHKEYKNIFHTKIFRYLAKSIKKNYQKY